MKKINIIILCQICLTFSACAQWNFNKAKKDLNKAGKEVVKEAENIYNSAIGKTNPLSNDEIIKGLREALTIGTTNSSSKASQVGGYLNNPAIKIPWPEDAIKIKNTVDNLGLSSQTQKVIETMNKAAEIAAKDAAPLFINAITGMSIGDGLKILKGADNEATKYLQDKTTAQLKEKFKPVIQTAIDKVELTKYWKPVISTYNKVPTVQKMNPDLNDYITVKAMDGLFKLIADEELKIRKDPTARVTDLLKKVFGS